MRARSVGLNDWLMHFFRKGWHHSWNCSVIGMDSFAESSTMRKLKNCPLGNEIGLGCSVYGQAKPLRELCYIFLFSIYPRRITILKIPFLYCCLILLNCYFSLVIPKHCSLVFTQLFKIKVKKKKNKSKSAAEHWLYFRAHSLYHVIGRTEISKIECQLLAQTHHFSSLLLLRTLP